MNDEKPKLSWARSLERAGLLAEKVDGWILEGEAAAGGVIRVLPTPVSSGKKTSGVPSEPLPRPPSQPNKPSSPAEPDSCTAPPPPSKSSIPAVLFASDSSLPKPALQDPLDALVVPRRRRHTPVPSCAPLQVDIEAQPGDRIAGPSEPLGTITNVSPSAQRAPRATTPAPPPAPFGDSDSDDDGTDRETDPAWVPPVFAERAQSNRQGTSRKEGGRDMFARRSEKASPDRCAENDSWNIELADDSKAARESDRGPSLNTGDPFYSFGAAVPYPLDGLPPPKGDFPSGLIDTKPLALEETEAETRSFNKPDLKTEMAELFEMGDFTGAQAAAAEILRVDPANAAAARYHANCEEVLTEMLESHIGALDRVPIVRITTEEILWRKLDAATGFVLSRIDGELTFEDVIDVSGLPRLKTVQILSRLLEEGIIA